MIVRLDDNGRCINLKLREKLEVRLPESMVSGYVWEYKEGCPVLRLDDSDYAERGPARFHGQGERSWHFAAVATGQLQAELLSHTPLVRAVAGIFAVGRREVTGSPRQVVAMTAELILLKVKFI